MTTAQHGILLSAPASVTAPLAILPSDHSSWHILTSTIKSATQQGAYSSDPPDASQHAGPLSSRPPLDPFDDCKRYKHRSGSQSGSSSSTVRASTLDSSFNIRSQRHGASGSRIDRVFNDLSRCAPRDLMVLHYQYSFNARLILQATMRQLQYAQEDLELSQLPDQTRQLLLTAELSTLDQVSTFFFPCGYIEQAEAFYIGFWTAWTEVRRIALTRLSELRWLRGIELIDVALEQVRHHSDYDEALEAVRSLRLSSASEILTHSCLDEPTRTALQALDRSITQTSLYSGYHTQHSTSTQSDTSTSLTDKNQATDLVGLPRSGLEQVYQAAGKRSDFPIVSIVSRPSPSRSTDSRNLSFRCRGIFKSFATMASTRPESSVPRPALARTNSLSRSADIDEEDGASSFVWSLSPESSFEKPGHVIEHLKPAVPRFLLD